MVQGGGTGLGGPQANATAPTKSPTRNRPATFICFILPQRGLRCHADLLAGTGCEYRLAPNGPCVDTGQYLFTNDGGLIEFDLDGQSRLDAGLPDVGASELH